MEQQLIKPSFSVATKLLMSVLLLVVVVIVFLSFSAIFLLQEDKEAYVFQSKLTEAVLAGNELSNTVNHARDTLQIAFANAYPENPIGPEQLKALQSIIDNQSAGILVMTGMLNRETGKFLAAAVAAKKNIDPADFVVSEEWFKKLTSDLDQDGLSFFNYSESDRGPMLGLIMASKVQGPQIPLAIWVIPLRNVGSELHGLNLTVATGSGWVLYDTDPALLYSKANISENPLFRFAKQSQTKNGTYSYEQGGERYLGSYVLPGFNLVIMTKVDWKKAMQATYALTEKFILLGLGAVGAAILFAIFFAKTLTAPINRLYEATKQVAAGDFQLSLDIKSRDEIGALTESFNVMSGKIGDLLKETALTTQLESELEIASTVQQNLIPPAAISDELADIHSFYQPASQCGGDWWGYFRVNQKIVIGIADATGHGVQCALVTAAARSCFSFLNKIASEDPDFTFSPGAMLEFMNHSIFDASAGKIHMTFFMGVLDFAEWKITYANGGHNPPWLFRNSGNSFQPQSLTSTGKRLGESDATCEFEEKSAQIGLGDILFLYTDGLMESFSATGELYSKKRMRSVIEASVAQGPAKIIEDLLRDYHLHNDGSDKQDDDITVVALRIGGSAEVRHHPPAPPTRITENTCVNLV